MTEQTQKDWRDLCADFLNENDPKKLKLLIQELFVHPASCFSPEWQGSPLRMLPQYLSNEEKAHFGQYLPR